jgi:acyl-CoA synthetase (NDP forming)
MEMAGSKGKPFAFKHCFKLLQNLDKWKARNQETEPKKSDMLRLDDSDDEGRNDAKPEGTKKAKERMRMEAEAASMRDKVDQMIKAKETLTIKTLEAKLVIMEKKEVKLAKLEIRREDAKHKAELEERMIKLKEAKAWKELMAVEKEHIMMATNTMNKEQLQWWKETKADIMERKLLLRSASSTA